MRCSAVLVDPPMAISTLIAFSKARRVAILRGVIPSPASSTILSPASLASLNLSAATAGTVPFPGRARPRASARQFMLLAVNSPEQDPIPGHITSSSSFKSSSVILPAATSPTASNILSRPTALPLKHPASIGPPLITTAGMSSLIAAMSIPGTILSQFGMSTIPSKGWAIVIISMESAMSSLLPREYFIPICPMAMPSQTPMVPNSIGVPPALLIPALTISAMEPRPACPGTTSLAELAMPIIGRAISSSVKPRAFIRERCGARVTPVFIESLLMVPPLVMHSIVFPPPVTSDVPPEKGEL